MVVGALLLGLILGGLTMDAALRAGINLGRLVPLLDQSHFRSSPEASADTGKGTHPKVASPSSAQPAAVAADSDYHGIAELRRVTNGEKATGSPAGTQSDPGAASDRSGTAQDTGAAADADAGSAPSGKPDVPAPNNAPPAGAEDTTAAGAKTAAAEADEWQRAYDEAHQAQLRGDLAQAAKLFERAARLNPRHPAILYDWGYVLQLQGKEEAAAEKYRSALALNPNHAYALYNLGFLAQKNGDEDLALHYYNKAGRVDKQNPYLYYDWAEILEKRGEIAKAASLYETAVELAPESQPGIDAAARLTALHKKPAGDS